MSRISVVCLIVLICFNLNSIVHGACQTEAPPCDMWTATPRMQPCVTVEDCGPGTGYFCMATFGQNMCTCADSAYLDPTFGQSCTSGCGTKLECSTDDRCLFKPGQFCAADSECVSGSCSVDQRMCN